jgi:hypothetical protein
MKHRYIEGDRVFYRNGEYTFVAYDGDDGAIIENFDHRKITVYVDYLRDKN